PAAPAARPRCRTPSAAWSSAPRTSTRRHVSDEPRGAYLDDSPSRDAMTHRSILPSALLLAGLLLAGCRGSEPDATPPPPGPAGFDTTLVDSTAVDGTETTPADTPAIAETTPPAPDETARRDDPRDDPADAPRAGATTGETFTGTAGV